MTLAEMLESIRTRKAIAPYGVSVASAYLSAMAPCLTGGDLCPTKLFKLASADLWAKELADAADRMTYCSAEMADPDFMQKSAREGTDITKGAVLEYDCILSSKSKDRDGDIIEQKGGLEIDPKMPLLWQHIQVSPIGKHVALLDQDEFLTKSRFAIADTELGRDAAVLVKFGALRKSHGFRPSEFTPLEIVKGHDGRDVVKGWHIKKAKCMEGSTVSIPANADTAILATYEKEFDGLATAFSKNLLHHPMVKHWAKGVYDSRTVQAPGVTLATKQSAPETKATFTLGGAKIELSTKGMEIGDTEDADPKKCTACGKKYASGKACPHCEAASGKAASDPLGATDSGGAKCPDCGKNTLDKTGTCSSCGRTGGKPKGILELTEKMWGGSSPFPQGSWEEAQSALRRTAPDHLKSTGITIDDKCYVDLVATFPGAAVVCVSTWNESKAKDACYQIAWSSKDGKTTWSGEPSPVEIKATVVAKMLSEVGRKSAQQLSTELVVMATGSPDPKVLKACDDVAAMASVLHSQHEKREFDELLNI